jgi:hypothetical protein
VVRRVETESVDDVQQQQQTNHRPVWAYEERDASYAKEDHFSSPDWA